MGQIGCVLREQNTDFLKKRYDLISEIYRCWKGQFDIYGQRYLFAPISSFEYRPTSSVSIYSSNSRHESALHSLVRERIE